MYTPNSPDIVKKKNNARRSCSSNILPNYQYEKLQTGFDMLSTIFRLEGSSNLGIDYFRIFEYIHEFF